jgi:tetratricopeptide (TPR) repeat protein
MPRVLLYAGAALVLVAALLLAFLPRREAPSGPTPFAPGSQVVAVMAIDNRTTDAELRTADVGRILSDAFVQILYDCKGVQVVSPARLHSLVSAEERSFADTALDDKLARLVCRRSGANTFLSGVLSQIGATYVLHATLTDLGSGRLLGSFEARSHGKEKLLEMLTADLGASVQRTLGGAGGAAIEVGGGLGDVMSYDFEAMMHLSRGTDLNNTGLFQEAVVELQRAVARDPNLALAWSELSCAYSFTGKDTMAARANERAQQLGQRLSRREHRWVEANGVWLAGSGPRYREVLGRFLDDYPDDRQGHFYEGLSWEWLDKDCRQAIASFEKAYRLTPDFFPITKGFVDCYLELGEPERAVAALERYLAVVKSGPGADQARGRLQDLRRAKRA